MSDAIYERMIIKSSIRKKTMSALIPILGSFYVIGGSTLGLVLLIVIIVVLVR